MNKLTYKTVRVVNPLRMGELIVHTFDDFIHSEWLVNKRNRLRSRFYNRKRLINGTIKWLLIISGSGLVGAVLLYLVYLVSPYIGCSSSQSMLGFAIGMAIIATGLWLEYWLNNIFPTDSYDMSCKYRR